MDDEEIDAEYFPPDHGASYHSLANEVNTTPQPERRTSSQLERRTSSRVERRTSSRVRPTSSHDVGEQNGVMTTYFLEQSNEEGKLNEDYLNGDEVNEDKSDGVNLNGDKPDGVELDGDKPDEAMLERIKPNRAKLNEVPKPDAVKNEDVAKREMSFSDVLQNPAEMEHFKVCDYKHGYNPILTVLLCEYSHLFMYTMIMCTTVKHCALQMYNKSKKHISSCCKMYMITQEDLSLSYVPSKMVLEMLLIVYRQDVGYLS